MTARSGLGEEEEEISDTGSLKESKNIHLRDENGVVVDAKYYGFPDASGREENQRNGFVRTHNI